MPIGCREVTFHPRNSSIHRKNKGNFKNYLRFPIIYPYLCVVEKEAQYIQRIFEVAYKLFNKRGFKAVSMDDLAKDAGMSKKTIYKYYDSKAHLIKALVEVHIDEKTRQIAKIVESAANPIQEMVEIGHLVYKHHKEMSSDILTELKKYYYDIWLYVDNMQQKEMLEGISCNIKDGIKLGLYRSDIAPDFITQVYVASVVAACDREGFSGKVHMQYLMLFEYHMYGIMTDEGRSLFEHYKTKLNQ